ncbi:tetratricopeptide repeat-containing sulfotransferase family protein [Pseudoxanthomonas suwonensis]|uniref:tetratricopeptide repeat-containing sulfotransferase family protein n=1 Tax=Pseudoxanthomonas suwonensis TaxID=314722 RepID=UPI000464CC91|nr:tetratricopeptide repeat-containing sulfotransferase family protein [Pseudoxanthomonas suwonensis]
MTASAFQNSLQQAALLERQGRPGDALQALQRAATEAGSDPQQQRGIAQAAMRLGSPALALAAMRRAVELAPGNPGPRFELACLLAHEGLHAEAVGHFQATVAAQPLNAQAWHLLGLALQRGGRHGDALQALRRSQALAPGNPRLAPALAEAEFHAGYPEDALPLWQAQLRERPDDVNALLRTAETLNRLGRHEEALALLREASTRLAQAGDLWMALAQTAEDAGDREAARQAYRQALAGRPDWAFPVSGLLGLDRGKADEALVGQARALMARPDLPDPDRALVGYELGKVHDARGEYAEAIECWHQANAARRRMIGPGDAAGFAGAVGRIIATLDGARLRARTARWPGNPDPRPLFIVGMPRSGTTLTEQILAAHPAGHGCGELPDIALVARNLPATAGPGRDWPECIDDLPDAALDEAARRYLRAATRHAPAQAQRLVDKAPLNFFHLGLIAVLFPNARVVWCRRDPRDIAVSVYGENFALEEKLACDLGDIGHYINQQTRLMRHWQAQLPLPVLELHYEALATDPETQARRLVGFAGLDWDPACLEFHRSERGVQTPSRWQVKQPIYTRSIGRWRHYAAHLGPLLDVLDPDAYPASVGVATNDQASTPSA